EPLKLIPPLYVNDHTALVVLYEKPLLNSIFRSFHRINGHIESPISRFNPRYGPGDTSKRTHLQRERDWYGFPYRRRIRCLAAPFFIIYRSADPGKKQETLPLPLS